MQQELFIDDVSPLFGLRVKFEGNKKCCGNVAVIGHSCGPHFAELRCASCGAHRGWLSKRTAAWLQTIVNKFGAPTTPIDLRRPT